MKGERTGLKVKEASMVYCGVVNTEGLNVCPLFIVK